MSSDVERKSRGSNRTFYRKLIFLDPMIFYLPYNIQNSEISLASKLFNLLRTVRNKS